MGIRGEEESTALLKGGAIRTDLDTVKSLIDARYLSGSEKVVLFHILASVFDVLKRES